MRLLDSFINALCARLREQTVNWTLRMKWTGFMDQGIKDFISKIRLPALSVEAKTGIPWRFAMVQAYHESRHGLSRLTVEANNLFGITGDSWYTQGKPVYWIMTTEYAKDKTKFEVKRPFRKYDSWLASLEDWGGLIERRYPKALAAAKMGNFEGFARGLQSGGYATDPKYADKLISLNSSLEGLS